MCDSGSDLDGIDRSDVGKINFDVSLSPLRMAIDFFEHSFSFLFLFLLTLCGLILAQAIKNIKKNV